MSGDLGHMFDTCVRCRTFKGKVETTPLKLIIVSTPMELVHVDFTRIETELNTSKLPAVNDVLVITDHFTQYAQAFMTLNQKAETVAKYCTIISS